MPKITKSQFKSHLFICTNIREGEEACGNKGSLELQQKVKKLVREKGSKDIRINKSGCLDLCSEGIAAALYPKNVFITGLCKESENDLLNYLEI